ncbi:MAG: ABC transporter permease [Acidobacteriota bacterium]
MIKALVWKEIRQVAPIAVMLFLAAGVVLFWPWVVQDTRGMMSQATSHQLTGLLSIVSTLGAIVIGTRQVVGERDGGGLAFLLTRPVPHVAWLSVKLLVGTAASFLPVLPAAGVILSWHLRSGVIVSDASLLVGEVSGGSWPRWLFLTGLSVLMILPCSQLVATFFRGWLVSFGLAVVLMTVLTLVLALVSQFVFELEPSVLETVFHLGIVAGACWLVSLRMRPRHLLLEQEAADVA